MTTRAHDAMLVTPSVVHYFFQSTQIAVTAGMIVSIGHGLGVVPTNVRASLLCLTSEQGYNVGDEVQLGMGTASGSGVVAADAANLTIIVQGTPSVPNKTTGTPVTITAADWRVLLRAWV